jgi:hypothetical protein
MRLVHGATAVLVFVGFILAVAVVVSIKLKLKARRKRKLEMYEQSHQRRIAGAGVSLANADAVHNEIVAIGLDMTQMTQTQTREVPADDDTRGGAFSAEAPRVPIPAAWVTFPDGASLVVEGRAGSIHAEEEELALAAGTAQRTAPGDL